jgi:hypothetical protein
LEAEAKTKALEAEAKARLLEAEARTKLLETEDTTKLLGPSHAHVRGTKIMLTDLETISDPARQNGLRTGRSRSGSGRLEWLAMAKAMAMARADKNASFVNLLFFGHVVDIASFCIIWMRWSLVGVARMAMTYV